MSQLRGVAEGLGRHDVRSYIASGNLVFEADGHPGHLSARLREALIGHVGVDVPILVLNSAVWCEALVTCPFSEDDGRHVHGMFCWDEPRIDEDVRDTLIVPGERLVARSRVVWLRAPNGIGRSKLAAKLDKVIVTTNFTARNLNTIRKIAEMLDRS